MGSIIVFLNWKTIFFSKFSSRVTRRASVIRIAFECELIFEFTKMKEYLQQRPVGNNGKYLRPIHICESGRTVFLQLPDGFFDVFARNYFDNNRITAREYFSVSFNAFHGELLWQFISSASFCFLFPSTW